MKKQSERKESIYIEEMNGFERVTQDLNRVYGCDLIYGDIGAMGTSETSSEIVGIVKGPRTKLNTDMFQRIAEVAPDSVIGYIGRHPERILNEDVAYTRQNIGEIPIFLVQAGQKEIPLLSMDRSPLSDAVAAYVSGMVNAVLQGTGVF